MKGIAIFAQLPAGVAEALHELGWHFSELTDVEAWRFMCDWHTSRLAIAALVRDMREVLGR